MLAAAKKIVKSQSSRAIATKVATVATKQSKNNSKSCLTDYTLDRDARSRGLGFHAALTYVASMLRMRPKPSAGLPTINAGTPSCAISKTWSSFSRV